MKQFSNYILKTDYNQKTYFFNSKNNVSVSIEKKLIEKSYVDDEIREKMVNFLDSQHFFSEPEEEQKFFSKKIESDGERLQIIIFAHGDCNFRCKYCYEKFDNKPIRNNIDKITRFISEKVNEKNYKTLQISWFGGEPLLGCREIFKISKRVKELALERNLEYISDMTTNGFLLTKKLATRLIEEANISMFQITIDGAKDGHDKQRLARSGVGTYEQIYKNLTDLKDSSLVYKVLLRFNVSQENYSSVLDFFHHDGNTFKNDKRFSVIIRNVGDWGQGERSCSYDVRLLEKSHVYELSRFAISKGYDVADPIFYISNHLGCYAQREDSFAIDVDGNILKCTVALYSEENIIGCLDSRILDVEREKLWINRFQLMQRCKNCNLLLICKGGACPKKTIFQEETFDEVCSKMKKLIYQNMDLLAIQDKVNYELKEAKS